ncbi:MAG: DEAD/DEAH box helicase family protein [Actinomycetia bacterium]|nr:DEAD/DEAH box helicase family protein [Actinomycetes bacterium]
MTELPASAQEPGPVLVASADTLLLQLAHPGAEAARAELAAFAELERSPDHVHTFRLSDIGLWNARAAGLDAEHVIDVLDRHTTGSLPHATQVAIADTMARFGRVTITERQPTPDHGQPTLMVQLDDSTLLDELLDEPSIAALVAERLGPQTVALEATNRGRLKQTLVEARWPADDQAAISPGMPFEFAIKDPCLLRPYQRHAVESWLPSGTGVIVLPCGAGKTITAIAAAAEIGANTLILVTGEASMHQWQKELSRFSDVNPEDVGVYAARRKEVKPITIATYHVMSTKRGGQLRHLGLIQKGDWGLIIYDEVHLLPAAVFQLTAGIQSRRRLGLTATLVREDGRQGDVFSLVGPKRFDVPWRELELQGWLAPAICTEVRVVPTQAERLAHAKATGQGKAKVAAKVEAKAEVVATLLDRHQGEPAIVIGTYLEGLDGLAESLGAPLVTGATSSPERLALFDDLRQGRLEVLVVSKVANFSLDLPEVSLAIQVSGTFGSRQEEAQRLGRILRPKADGRQAHFYTIVARDTVEQEYAQRRQLFLAEQGYGYEIVDGIDL